MRRFFVEIPLDVAIEKDDRVRIELADDDASARLLEVLKRA
jgi:hypothetical protein